jgi:hypothetical protein
MHATCPAHLILYLITLIFSKAYKLWNSSLCSLLQPHTTFSLSGPNVLLSEFFLFERDQVSHPHKTATHDSLTFIKLFLRFYLQADICGFEWVIKQVRLEAIALFPVLLGFVLIGRGKGTKLQLVWVDPKEIRIGSSPSQLRYVMMVWESLAVSLVEPAYSSGCRILPY